MPKVVRFCTTLSALMKFLAEVMLTGELSWVIMHLHYFVRFSDQNGKKSERCCTHERCRALQGNI